MSNDNTILKDIYPIVEQQIKKNMTAYKKTLSIFMQERVKELYDICPCDRIFFLDKDRNLFFESLNISEKEIKNKLSNTYYWSMSAFQPSQAKDPFTIVMLCVVRYFFKMNNKKELDLALIYLSFSGKFYPSIHYGFFQKFPPSEYRHIMEYVVNNKLSNKYDIKKEGNICNAVKSVANTWVQSYASRIKTYSDEDITYIIQQLHGRIKSFMKNIAKIYYDIYGKKDEYLTYDNDNLSDSDYHIADNDSFKIERIVEKSMDFIVNTSVDFKTCRIASDTNVKTDEVKSIIESILNDNLNIPDIKEVIRIIVTEYFLVSEKKDVRDIDFIAKSIVAKPNTKNKNIIKQKEIIEKWLMESENYRRRRNREPTRNSYHRSILTYFVLTIHNANK